ncbi:MAG: tRNA pseudouridine(55) synthase, partial [Verrucomicrobiota bacterium]
NPPEVSFDCAVSKGTYVRTLAHDAGLKLGCGGCLSALRRTKIDRFSIEQAKPLAELEEMGAHAAARELLSVAQAVPTHVL